MVEYVPAGQVLQTALDVAPVAVEYVPAPHDVHQRLPAPAYVPG